MIQALLAGVSSIKAQQTSMNVIGNDLANVNTTAFKSSTVTFKELMAQTVQYASGPTGNLGGTNPIQYGLGVNVAATQIDLSQGSLNATGRNSDLALSGNGYFQVSNGQAISYTRDGSFNVDSAGNLVMGGSGQKLLGWQATPTGTMDTTQQITPASTIKIPLGAATLVEPTKNVAYTGNLDPTAGSTASWTTQIGVYDSLGAVHNLTLQFNNLQSPPAASPAPPAGAMSSWGWSAYLGPSATGTPIATSASAGNTPIYFDGSGATVTGLPAGTFNTATIPATSATGPVTMNLDFSSMSQLSEASSVAVKNQDGYPAGSLQGFNIESDGTISGLFSNGLSRNLGQVALANFANPGALSNIGNNLYGATSDSGLPVVGIATNGAFGTISSGYLEQSNIDIGSEFSDLIIAQRGFQANTKIVTTVDQMLQDLIAMKQ